MKKFILFGLVFCSVQLVAFVPVAANGEAESLPAPTVEEQPVLQQGNEENENQPEEAEAEVLPEENRQSFINGVVVGGIVGVVLGGLLAWFFKEKLI